MQRLLINKFYGWISNDPSIWWVGSLYNAEWVDVHSDTKYIQLSKNNWYENLLNTRVGWYITSSIYESNADYVEASYDWYLSWVLNNSINNWYITQWDYGNIYNLGKITNPAWNTFWFWLTSDSFIYWAFTTNGNALWTYKDTSSWLVDEPSFSAIWSWTVWTNWAISNWSATHTTWDTAVLSQTITPTTSQKYRVVINQSSLITTWSCIVKIAWVTITTLTTSNENTYIIELYTASWVSELLEFIPSSDYDGSIRSVYVQEYNILDVSKTFTKYSPYLISQSFILAWNWNVITEIDMTTWTPVIQDILTIDKWFTIRWLTRIADQYFIYSTDWANTRQYLRNWVDATVTRQITWVDKPVQNVANLANIDYIVTWTSNRQSISIVNWTQLQPLIISWDWINVDNRKYINTDSTNSIETFWNRILMWWDGGIFSFWKRTPWLPNALIKEFTHAWAYITNMFFREDIWYNLYYYYRWTVAGVLWNYRVSNYLAWWSPNYWTLPYNTWWVQFNPNYWVTYSNLKILEKYTLWYKLETSTQINTYIKDTFYTNVYFSWTNTDFSIWDIYTFASRTFTILNITKLTSSNAILHCSYTGDELESRPAGTFTKTSWDWPTDFCCDLIRYWYRLLDMITDTTKTRFTTTIKWTYNEMWLAVELISANEYYTPKIYDFNLYFNENSND